MRILSINLVFVVAVLVSACEFWPKELEPLAESISQQVYGETTIWLVGGDVVLIDVSGSPLYRAPQSELETRATEIAEQTIEHVKAPLESIVITIHESEVSEDPERMHEFIFLVMDDRPVLQPHLDLDATGPLTPDEIQFAIDRLGETVAEDQQTCILEEVEKRADTAGDPETLNPESMKYLTSEFWNDLDASSKRLILTQAIVTEALFVCAQRSSSQGDLLTGDKAEVRSE